MFFPQACVRAEAPDNKADQHFSYGGQALIEGVMIRGRAGYSTAFRLADGQIQVQAHRWEPLTKRHKLLGLPIIRGTPALMDALVIGYRALIASADAAAKGEGIKPPNAFHYGISIAVALVIVIGGFVLLPSAVVQPLHMNKVAFAFIEGLLRAAFFVLFILLVSRMPDMRRVFQYHGAEHKVINSFEATHTYDGSALEKYGTLHPRCGTSFIFMVLFVGIFVHAFVKPPQLHLLFLSRLIMLPIVAGVAYELIKLAGSHKSSRLLNALVTPGILLQKITTQEPSPDQVEVAIKALDSALELDRMKV